MPINNVYKQVFREQVWNFYASDLESCLKSAKDAQDRAAAGGDGSGGQNFTAALLILSVIDFQAGFYVGKTNGVTSADDAAKFMVRYFTDYALFQSEAFCKKFYQVFRHGLSHTWSPKGAGVGMDLAAGTDRMLYIEDNVPYLNVKPFYELTRKALQRYEEDLGTDEDLNKRFVDHYKYIWDNGEQEANELKAMITASPTTTPSPGVTSTTSTTTSLPTII